MRAYPRRMRWKSGSRASSYIDEDVRPADHGEDVEAAFVQYVREKIHLLKRRQASGKVENSTGFLLQAIRQNYANPEFAQEQKREASAATQQAKQRDTETGEDAGSSKRLISKKPAIGNSINFATKVAAESPDVLEQAVAELLAEDKGFLFTVQAGQVGSGKLSGAAISPGIFQPIPGEHDPARFETIRQRYAAQIAAVDAQIAALGD